MTTTAEPRYYEEWRESLTLALAEPFAPEDHKTKRQGGSDITFVDVHRYKERLTSLVGPHGWSATVRFDVVGGKLIATVALTVLGVTKENVGDEVEVPELNERGNEKIIGSPATNSYSQAFKRACADFGLGAYLYDEAKRNAATGGQPPRRSSNGGGAPKAGPGPATQKQIGLIETLLKSEVFTEDERDGYARKIAAGITKAQASEYIDRIQAEKDTRVKNAVMP